MAAQRPKQDASNSKPSLWLVSSPLFVTSSANLTAIGALAEICLRIASARVIKFSGWNDFVDQPDAIGLLRANHPSGENQLQGPAFSDQPRQALGAATTRNKFQLDFGLAELRVLRRDPDGASHRRLAAAAECKSVDGSDHRLTKVFDQIEDLLSETARLLCFENGFNIGDLTFGPFYQAKPVMVGGRQVLSWRAEIDFIAPTGVRIPTIATTHSDGSRPAVPIDRDQSGAGAESAVG